MLCLSGFELYSRWVSLLKLYEVVQGSIRAGENIGEQNGKKTSRLILFLSLFVS